MRTSILAVILVISSTYVFTRTYHSDKLYRVAQGSYSKMDWQEAISSCGKSIDAMPLNAAPYSMRGGIYSLKATLAYGTKKEEYRQEATRDLLKAVHLDPYRSIDYLSLAWLYEKEENNGRAIWAFKKAIATNPTNGVPYYAYANYCLEQDMLGEALSAYRKGLGVFTEENSFLRFCGSGYHSVFKKIYAHTRDYAQLKSAVPDDKLDVHLAFAGFLERRDRIPEARKEYKEILTKYPDDERARSAVERLGKE